MNKTLLAPLLAGSLLTACAATPSPAPVAQDKPTLIQQQDIQRLAQQGQERALNAREQQAETPDDTNHPPVLAGAPPVPPRPPVAGGIRIPPQAHTIHDKLKPSVSPENTKALTHGQ